MKSFYKPIQSLLLAVLTMLITACSEGHVDDARAYSSAVYQSLVRAGICKNLGQCSNDEYALWKGSNPWELGKERVHVNIYRMKDAQVMELIAQNVSAEIEQRKGPPCELRFFPGPHFNEGLMIKKQIVE